jgi:hypothetical protein
VQSVPTKTLGAKWGNKAIAFCSQLSVQALQNNLGRLTQATLQHSDPVASHQQGFQLFID